MKKIIALILLFSISWAEAQSIVRTNADGFPTCYSNSQKVYFFAWDQMLRTATKQVSYFELNDYIKATGHRISGCDQAEYLQTVPDEILKPINNLSQSLFPEKVTFALNEVAQGAHQFYFEKTPAQFIENHWNLFQPDSPEVLSGLRYNVGDQQAETIIHTWSQQLFLRSAQKCDAAIGTCDFYLCQEQNHPCGVAGYNLGFGYKYCSGSKFKLLPQMQKALGRSWVQNVFQCLQKRSWAESQRISDGKTCESIQKTSIASHPDCYVEAGFCKLSHRERLLIFNLIKAEIFSTDTVTQGLRILQLCQDKDIQ